MAGGWLATLDAALAARADALLDAALDLDQAGRAALLAQTRRDDARLADALERLLQALDAPAAIDQPLHKRSFDDDSAQPSPGPQAPARVGPWALGELAGRGGMAAVYRAERADGAYVQEVAIKLLDSAEPSFAARFQTERNLLAQLEHPHIARLLDGGISDDGRPWLAMTWVGGDDLDVYLARARPVLSERLKCFDEIASAVAHAHQRLIVHRDLKPRNVRVTPQGHAVLLDFGIARLLSHEQAAGRTRAVFTPEYAAPEQLAGLPASTLTDVHALGLLLYELLSGVHPFPDASDSLAAAVDALCRRVPAPPSLRAGAPLPYPARALRGDLDAIVLRCLEKDPERRYPSVAALREDLERHRLRLPVLARRGAWRYAVGRWLSRNWLAAGLGALVLLGLVGGSAVVWVQAGHVRQERDVARLEARRQEALREHLMLVFREGAAQGGSTTAKQLLDTSAEQLDALYGKTPDLRRAVLLSMGELYSALGDFAAARAMLERFIAQIGPDVAVDEQVLAYGQLAQTLIRLGEREAAAQALARARALRGPASAPVREIDALLLATESMLKRSNGDIEEGLALQRRSVALSRQAVDSTPLRIGVGESNLGMALLQANRLADARAEYQRAIASFTAAGLGRSANAVTALGNLANVQALLGDLRGAEAGYVQAEALATEAMARSATMAALLNNHARLLLTLARFAEAEQRSEEAIALAIQFTGEDSVDLAGIRITAAEIALERGDLVGARALALTARAALMRRLGATHPLIDRVELTVARIDLAELSEGASARVQAAAARLRAGPPLLARQALRAELALAEAALGGGDRGAANAAIARAEADPALAQAAPWERDELSVWGAAVRGESDPRALERLAAALGAEHPRVRRLRGLTAD